MLLHTSFTSASVVTNYETKLPQFDNCRGVGGVGGGGSALPGMYPSLPQHETRFCNLIPRSTLFVS